MSPTYFAAESFIGGGERFAEELSRAMSERIPVRFVSFGRRAFRERVTPSFERVVLRSWTRDKMTPFAPALWRELRGARVIHCHQYHTLPTFLAALYGRLARVPVFVSDLGGGGWTPGYHIDISRWIRGHLPISRYAAARIHGANRTVDIIYGGVDLKRYPARTRLDHDGTVVFLGRLLPHKGIHLLIEGLPMGVPLRVIGPVTNRDYFVRLREITRGKAVEFRTTLSDAEVGAHLRDAMTLVHPTPVDASGEAGVFELLGLAVIEAMASNCPPVVTQAASLPEIVEHERSGLIVPPNDPKALGEAVERLRDDRSLWKRLAGGARTRVDAEFAWPRVVERCFEAYCKRGGFE